mgnify:CR=1 FL=1
METKHKASDLLAVLVPILTFVVGLSLDQTTSSRGYAPFYTALLIFLVCLLAASLYTYALCTRFGRYFIATCKGEFCTSCKAEQGQRVSTEEHLAKSVELMGRLRNEVPHYVLVDGKVRLHNVITATQLADKESTLPGGAEIWIVTATLIEELPQRRFNSVVERNLARGIRYKYFVPARATLDGEIMAVRDSHKAHHALIDFVTLPEDFFLLFPELDLAIYVHPVSGEPFAYIQLPTDKSEEPLYSIITDERYINAIVHRLRRGSLKPTVGIPATTTSVN